MSLQDLIARMPKIELHVHLEGSIRPETLLQLARRNGVTLPADTVEGLREWYRFRDFNHFVGIYVTASSCIKTADDLELVAREFVDGQLEQHVMHSEVTYTAETLQRICGIPWSEQWRALQSAREYALAKGMTLEYILDIVREVPQDVGAEVANWAIAGLGQGVCALGLTGVEADTACIRHQESFRRAKDAGLKVSTHAGETSGPQTIWDCLELLDADRIGHGIRCLEDDALVDELLRRRTPIEVCPSSNVFLCLAQSIESHPIQAMLARGLNVSVNSDDPPMFNTSLTQEWQKCVGAFDWTHDQVLEIQLETVQAAFVSGHRRGELEASVREFFVENQSG